jgi:hypothetical protein
MQAATPNVVSPNIRKNAPNPTARSLDVPGGCVGGGGVGRGSTGASVGGGSVAGG